ncbi:MAG: hypothetical protein WBC33_13070 [Conexibacter sp.]
MRRFPLATVGALIALVTVTASAAALETTLEPGGNIEGTSVGEISFRGAIVTIRCPVTLNGTLSRGPISLARGQPFGSVTDARIGRCSGGVAENVLNLPWALKFEVVNPAGAGKEGLESVLVILEGVSFQLSVFGEATACLYQGHTGGTTALTNEGEDRRGGWRYRAETIAALPSIRVPLFSGSEPCPSNGTFSGTFRVNPSQTFLVT